MNSIPTPRYLVCRIVVASPLIITRRHGDPNGAGTHPFIAGSALRGAVAQRLLSAGTRAESEEFRLLVLSGKVRYLNAYPEVHEARALPMPVSWRVLKSDAGRGWDLAYFPAAEETSGSDEDLEVSWPEEQLETPGAPFASATMRSGAWLTVTPEVGARGHHQRDRAKGRAWKDREGAAHGTIFAYEYLEPSQVFRGVIQLMPGADGAEAKLRELLAEPIVIGRSRRAGYGGDARVEFRESLAREYAGASQLLARDLQNGERFRILLVSSCIARDPRTGQPDPSALEREIVERLNGAVRIERRRWAFETVGGFNQKWGLEVPQACAVRAGSVFVARALRPLSLETLLALEHEGVGERRTEGFGRLALLTYDETARTIRLEPVREQKRLPDQPGPPDERAAKLLEFLERRIVLEAAETELRRAAWTLAQHAQKPPSNALLGRIRTLLREGHDAGRAEKALAELHKWVEEWRGESGKEGRKRAAEQLSECSLRGRKLLDWLADLVGADGQRWRALKQAVGDAGGLAALSQKNCLRSREQAEALLEQHAASLTVGFLDELMGALARMNRER